MRELGKTAKGKNNLQNKRKEAGRLANQKKECNIEYFTELLSRPWNMFQPNKGIFS